ncbi:MFS transporter [Pseudomonas shirazensis]|uniref:MFS transporter n=1 Tax=Pseudomonas shirazensis TaxID=2745494 RepID=UPI003D28F7E9
MPFVIYACALCAFAFGLSEFVVIGLAPALGASFDAVPAEVGQTVTWYALGVTLGGAILTALTSSMSRKRLLVGAVLLFSLVHIAMAIAPTLLSVVAARFVSGLTHGVFLAAAAATAAHLVGYERAGKAVALVFSGLTIALVFGVPLGAYLGEHLSWRIVMLSVAVFALVGAAILAKKVPYEPGVKAEVTLAERLGLLWKPELLAVLLVTVLSYTSLFTFYTYIAAFMAEVMHASEVFVGLALLAFGVSAVAGNLFGGWLRDGIGSLNASLYVVSALVVISVLIALLIALQVGAAKTEVLVMLVLAGGLGFVAFAAVAVFQSRIIEVAQEIAPHSSDVASGLNISGFNLGIVLGSLLGSAVISHLGITYLPYCSALVGLASLLALGVQRFSEKRVASAAC